MDKFKYAWNKFTKCDSGAELSPFLHVFLFITLVFSLAFLFFGDTQSVQSVILYQETLGVGQTAVNMWGIIGLAICAVHAVAFWFRGKIGAALMPVCLFGGFYLWAWAAVIYFSGGFILQFLATCIPNLAFWAWYTVQWRRRKRGETYAFV